MNFESIDYQVPAHWLCAIINGDESSFDYYDDSKDYAAFKAFCEHEVMDAIVEVTEDAEPYFSSWHDATAYGVLPCSVIDCVFHYPESTQLSLNTTPQTCT